MMVVGLGPHWDDSFLEAFQVLHYIHTEEENQEQIVPDIVLAFCIIMLASLILCLIFDRMSTLVLRVIKTWLELQTSIITFLVAYSLLYLGIQHGISVVQQSILALGSLSWLFVLMLRVTVFNQSGAGNLRIASMTKREILLKEAFKVIIVSQEYFLHHSVLGQSKPGHIGYYAFILVFYGFLALWSSCPSHLDLAFQSLVLTTQLICLFQLFIADQMFIQTLAFLGPVTFYAIYKGLLMIREKRIENDFSSFMSSSPGKQPLSLRKAETLIQLLIKELEENNESQLSRDNYLMLHYNHSLFCFDSLCICRQQERDLQLDHDEDDDNYASLSKRDSGNFSVAYISAHESTMNFNRHDTLCQQTNDQPNDPPVTLDQLLCNKKTMMLNDQSPLNLIQEESTGKRDSKTQYYKQLIGMLFRDFDKNLKEQDTKKSSWLQFTFTHALFIHKYLNLPYNAIYQISKIHNKQPTRETKKSLSFLKGISVEIQEQILMKEIMTKVNSGFHLDISAYMAQNIYLQEQDQFYQDTAEEFIKFWQTVLRSSSENLFDYLRVDSILKQGWNLTRNIQQIKRAQKYSSQLETQDLQRYTKNMEFFSLVLRDNATLDLMQAKVRELKIKSRLYVDRKQEEEQKALCLVTFLDKDQTIIYANSAFAKIQGVEDPSKLKGTSIYRLMPQIIRDNHDLFLKRFFNDYKGHTGLLARDKSVFIKDYRGYIIPVNIKLTLQFDPILKHSFLATFDTIEYMNCSLSFSDSSKIPISKAMIFLTDESTQLKDMNETACLLMGFQEGIEQYKQIEDSKIFSFALQNFIPEFDIAKALDQGSKIENQIVRYRGYSVENDDFDKFTTHLGVLTHVEETYRVSSKRSVSQHVFILVPWTNHPDIDFLRDLECNQVMANEVSSFNQQSETHKQDIGRRTTLILQEIAMKAVNSNRTSNISSAVPSPTGQGSQAVTNSEQDDHRELSSQVSSARENMNQMQILKSQLFSGRMPRIIRLTLYLLGVLLLAFVVLSSYNMIVFLQRHKDIANKIACYFKIGSRNLNFRRMLIQLRMLHLTSLNQSLDLSSNVLGGNISRLDAYKKKYVETKDVLYQQIEEIETFNQEHGTSYDLSVPDDTFDLLDQSNNIYKQNLSFKHANKLYLNYFDGLHLSNLSTVPLNVSDYPHVNATESIDFRNQLFFLIYNGVSKFSEMSLYQNLKILELTNTDAKTSQQSLQITSAISSVILSAIFYLLVPMLSRVIEKLYRVIKFVQWIDRNQIDKVIASALAYTTGTNVLEVQQVPPSKPSEPQAPSKALQIKEEVQHSERSEEAVEEASHEIKQEEKAQDIDKQLSKVSMKLRLYAFLAVTVFIGYLNGTLWISFYYSNQVFVRNQDSSQQLRNFLKREASVYNLNIFMREKLILNQTIMIKAQTSTTEYKNSEAIGYYLKYCLDAEQQISQMQHSMPPYLEKSKKQLNSIETQEVCKIVFEDPNECEKVLGGLLMNGMDGVMSYYVSAITQMNINFQSSQRSIQYLQQQIYQNQKFLDLTDLAIFYLHPIIQKQQSIAQQTSLDYYEQSKYDFITIFFVSLIVTLILGTLAGIFLGRSVNKSLQESQNMILILPLDGLKPEQLKDIEKYVNS